MRTGLRRIPAGLIAALLMLSALATEREAAAQTEEQLPGLGVAAVPDLDKLFEFLPDVAGRYNTTEISSAQVRAALPPKLVVQLTQGWEPEPAELRQAARAAVNQLINQLILTQTCIDDGFGPTPEEGEDKVREIEQKVGPEKFQAGLRHQGITREQLVARVALQAAVNKWMSEKIVAAIDAPESMLRKLYEENREAFRTPERVKVSHILVRVDQAAAAEERDKARGKATKLREEVVAGADFGEVARLHSDCPSAKNGGQLGALKRGDTVPPFEQAAFALEEGAISDVVQTRYGFHVVRSDGRMPSREVTFEEAHEKIRQAFVQGELNKALQAIVSAARNDAKVEIFVPEE